MTANDRFQSHPETGQTRVEAVFEASGLTHGSSAPALQTFLLRHRGVYGAEANSLNETVVVQYDPVALSEAAIRRLIEECGYHCRGQSMPKHLREPEAGPEKQTPAVHVPVHPAGHEAEAVHVAPAEAGHEDHPSQGEAHVSGELAHVAHGMGHGGGMSMDEMIADIKRRFWVAFLLAVPIFLYSPLFTDVIGLRPVSYTHLTLPTILRV